MASQTDQNEAADGPGPRPGPRNINIRTIDKRWVSNDLQLLRSGLLADAEIVCEGDATPRKVHRTILVGRSTWFKKAFTGGFKEATERKVNLQETPWRVDLMLYFFYTGGIDLTDEALTKGHDVMDIGIELVRLGDFFKSTDMRLHGREMLIGYLCSFLSRICQPPVFGTMEGCFRAETNFPQRFCAAVVNAFNKERPVRIAQRVLADFAFAARIHLFKNTEFTSFIRDQVVPEFGNLVLEALMTGSVSNVFNDNSAFQQWQDWRVTPPTSPSPQPQFPAQFGTATPPVAGGSGTASPEVAGFGRGRGRGSGSGRGGGSGGGRWGFTSN